MHHTGTGKVTSIVLRPEGGDHPVLVTVTLDGGGNVPLAHTLAEAREAYVGQVVTVEVKAEER